MYYTLDIAEPEYVRECRGVAVPDKFHDSYNDVQHLRVHHFTNFFQKLSTWQRHVCKPADTNTSRPRQQVTISCTWYQIDFVACVCLSFPCISIHLDVSWCPSLQQNMAITIQGNCVWLVCNQGAFNVSLSCSQWAFNSDYGSILIVTEEGTVVTSEVMAFLKRDSEVISDYIQINTSSGQHVTLSGSHLIYTRHNSNEEFYTT